MKMNQHRAASAMSVVSHRASLVSFRTSSNKRVSLAATKCLQPQSSSKRTMRRRARTNANAIALHRRARTGAPHNSTSFILSSLARPSNGGGASVRFNLLNGPTTTNDADNSGTNNRPLFSRTHHAAVSTASFFSLPGLASSSQTDGQACWDEYGSNTTAVDTEALRLSLFHTADMDTEEDEAEHADATWAEAWASIHPTELAETIIA